MRGDICTILLLQHRSGHHNTVISEIIQKDHQAGNLSRLPLLAYHHMLHHPYMALIPHLPGSE